PVGPVVDDGLRREGTPPGQVLADDVGLAADAGGERLDRRERPGRPAALDTQVLPGCGVHQPGDVVGRQDRLPGLPVAVGPWVPQPPWGPGRPGDAAGQRSGERGPGEQPDRGAPAHVAAPVLGWMRIRATITSSDRPRTNMRMKLYGSMVIM